jgi:hypothetical protein
MLVRKGNACVYESTLCELWTGLLRRTFERELWESRICCVVGYAGVEDIDC